MALIESNNPWLGLASYQAKDANMFFGREEEIAAMLEIIKRNYSTVIYGKSGIGKTSLINAGLIPALERDGYLPVPVKLEHNTPVGYDRQIINAVTRKMQECNGEIESEFTAQIPDECRLWFFFHACNFWSADNHRLTPVVFIDQFEEIFTICDNQADAAGFFKLVNDLFQQLPPSSATEILEQSDSRIDFSGSAAFRLIVSMREDFLARLEDYSRNVPSMRKNRVGLAPVNGLQSLSVIMKPAPGIIDRQSALRIIAKVAKLDSVEDDEETLRSIHIETCILSLFCTQMYRKAASLKKDTISAQIIDQFGDDIINDYYTEFTSKISKDSIKYLEDNLLTSSGFRNALAYEDVVPEYVEAREIDILEQSRIIRKEIVNKATRIEFTHDVLCGVALEHKNKRRQRSERSSRKRVRTYHLAECAVFLIYLFILFFKPKEYGNEYASYPPGAISDNPIVFAVSIVLLFTAMLSRNAVALCKGRSWLFTIFSFIYSYLACVVVAAISSEWLNVHDDYWFLWSSIYGVLTMVTFVASCTKQRSSSFRQLWKMAFSYRQWHPSTPVSLKYLAGCVYLLLAITAGVYMSTGLAVGLFICLIPVMLLLLSIWKKSPVAGWKLPALSAVGILALYGMYSTQYTTHRIYSFALLALLLVITYLAVHVLAAKAGLLRKSLAAVAVWAVAFLALPCVILGFNLWNLGDYAVANRGVIHCEKADHYGMYDIYHPLNGRYIVVKDEVCRYGAFDRYARTLLPARFYDINPQAVYKYYGTTFVGDILDFRFYVNKTDSVELSDYLQYQNVLSKGIENAYRQLFATDYIDSKLSQIISEESKHEIDESKDKDTSKKTITSDDSAPVNKDIDFLCKSDFAKFSVTPSTYLKLARYYHSKDSAEKEFEMLSKALLYTMAMDSTASVLNSDGWNAEEQYDELVAAIVYIKTKYIYSNYKDEFKEYFFNRTDYLDFIKRILVDMDPGEAAEYITSNAEFDWEINVRGWSSVRDNQIYQSLGLRNPGFSKLLKKVVDREPNLISRSYSYIFMGEYNKAKELSIRAMEEEATDSIMMLAASTNLLTSCLFLGDYEEAARILDLYRGKIFGGRFYQDIILEDLNNFFSADIIDDIPREVYINFIKGIDPKNNRYNGNLYVHRAGDCPGICYWGEENYEPGSYYKTWYVEDLHPFHFVTDDKGDIISPIFDEVYLPNLNLSDDYDFTTPYDIFTHDPIVIYAIDGKMGFYDATRLEKITEAQFDYAWRFSEGLAAVAQDDKVGFINEQGEMVIPCQYYYDDADYSEYYFESDGRCTVYIINPENDYDEVLWGVIDTQGNLILPFGSDR